MTLDLKALKQDLEQDGFLPQGDARALIDELTEARRAKEALDEEEGRRSARIIEFCTEAQAMLGEDYSDWRKVNFDSVLAAMKAALAHARAAALADADRHLRQHDSALADVLDLEALSATPATVVCVPVKTWELAAKSLKHCELLLTAHEREMDQPRIEHVVYEARAALAEMAKVTP